MYETKPSRIGKILWFIISLLIIIAIVWLILWLLFWRNPKATVTVTAPTTKNGTTSSQGITTNTTQSGTATGHTSSTSTTVSNGQAASTTSSGTVTSTTVPAATTTLANTGPGNVFLIAAIVSVAGTLFFHVRQRQKNA